MVKKKRHAAITEIEYKRIRKCIEANWSNDDIGAHFELVPSGIRTYRKYDTYQKFLDYKENLRNRNNREIEEININKEDQGSVYPDPGEYLSFHKAVLAESRKTNEKLDRLIQLWQPQDNERNR